MPQIPDRLWLAIAVVAGMENPSVPKIPRGFGYGYEAAQIEELIAAFEEARSAKKGKKR